MSGQREVMPVPTALSVRKSTMPAAEDAGPARSDVLGRMKDGQRTAQFIQRAVFHGASIKGDARGAAGEGGSQHSHAAGGRLSQRPGEDGRVQGSYPPEVQLTFEPTLVLIVIDGLAVYAAAHSPQNRSGLDAVSNPLSARRLGLADCRATSGSAAHRPL
jgi:hypothetical protein